MQLLLAREPCLATPGGRPRPLAALDAALLAWLALEGPTPRARLAQLLWPDKDAEAARNSLRQRLFQLRKATGAELVRGSATLALAEGVAHDLDEADTVLGEAAGEDLAPGEFAQWLEAQRSRRRDRVRRALVDLCAQAEMAKDWDDALIHARELLALEPLSEEAHRRVIRLHYLAGDRAAALLAFDRCEQMLKDEIGTRPSAQTLQLLEAIDRGAARDLVPAMALPATVLRPPRMVGRVREFQTACSALTQGQVAWVTGEAGLGKSRLLQEVAAAVPGSLVCAARPGDDAVAGSSLARLVRRIVDHLGQIGDTPTLPDLAAPPAAVTRAVSALLDLAQVRGVVAVGIDDLHFADRTSLDVLAHLLHAERGYALGWLLAQRSADVDPALRRARDALLDDQRLHPLALAPLDISQVEELLAALALPALDVRALAARLYRHTGGNPLYLLETVRQAWATGELQAAPGALPTPNSVAQLIERRLRQLSPAAFKLARCAAIAGGDFSLALASRVLKLDALDLADPWGELERAQVFSGGSFAHDLIYEAALASVPGPIATHLHALIADDLAASAGDVARIARHREAAGQWAAASAGFRDSAQSASRQGRIGDAVSLLGDALRCADAQGDEMAGFDVCVEQAVLLGYFEYGPRAVQALAELDRRSHDEPRRVAALAARMIYQCMRGEAAAVLAEAPQVVARARAIGRLDLELRVVEAWCTALRDQRAVSQAVELLQPYVQRFDAIGDARQRFSLWIEYALALDYAGRLREAVPVWERAEAVARDAGLQGVAWQAVSGRAMTNAKLGHVKDAAETSLAALREARSRGDMTRERLAGAESTVAHRLRDAGRYAEALSLLLPCLELWATQDNPVELAWVEHRLAWLYQLLGQPERALRLLATDRPQLPVGLRTMRLVHQADVKRQLGGDGVPLVRQALALIADEQDIYWRIASLFATRCVPPEEGAVLAGNLAVWAMARERHGLALAGHVRAAACLLATNAPVPALPHAEAALRLAREYQPDTFYLAEAWLVGARVWAANGHHDEAQRVLHVGRTWVHERAERDVPPEFRHSFLERNEVNRDLMSTMARLQA